MNRKEVIEMAIESPLYFTMSVKNRLDYINQWERCFSKNGLRQALLSWVRTGHFDVLSLPSMPSGKASPIWKTNLSLSLPGPYARQ
jgi:hypothetical protein